MNMLRSNDSSNTYAADQDDEIPQSSNQGIPNMLQTDNESTALNNNHDESGESSLQHPARSEQLQKLHYEVRHRTFGRLRLKVYNLSEFLYGKSSPLIDSIFFTGVIAVKCDAWSRSVVIEYDRHVLSEQQLLQHLDNLAFNAEAALQPVGLREIKTRQGISAGVASLMERLLPPTAQVIMGLAALAAGLFEFPVLATRILIGAATLPVVTRALRAATVEHKLGIDALDGTAAYLMISGGKIVEAGFMLALIGLGEFIREKTSQRCEKMVTDLLGLSGRSAWLIRGSKRICISADDVKVNDTVVVYPGDMIPVDGEVIKGFAAVDQSKLTGEPMPVEVKPRDKVFASTVLVEGKIYIRCEAAGSETKAGLVLQYVNDAPLHETTIQNHASALADKVVLPMFVAASACFWVTRDISRLMSMLILDFCTGIRIAAPTSVLSSMHRAGRRGILVKSGAALEKLSGITAIVFDKTGTLTSGEPVVEQVTRFNGYTEDEVLSLAASVEMRLHHPAARAIVKAAQQKSLSIAEQDESSFSRGLGVKATVGQKTVIVGSKNMMIKEGISIDDARDSEVQATQLGESIAYVAINGKVAGLIRYKDRLRPEARAAIAELKKLGVKKLVMATGDTQEAGLRIAQVCGLSEVIGRAFPEDKAQLVQQLKAEGHKVAVIGDGINDSPALAFADVAISLKGATDAARHSADLVLTDDNLQRLPEAIRIARGAMNLVKQNLVMAVVPNSAGFALAACGMLGPAGATILNNGAAMAAAVNGLRPLYSNTWSTAETIDVKPNN